MTHPILDTAIPSTRQGVGKLWQSVVKTIAEAAGKPIEELTPRDIISAFPKR